LFPFHSVEKEGAEVTGGGGSPRGLRAKFPKFGKGVPVIDQGAGLTIPFTFQINEEGLGQRVAGRLGGHRGNLIPYPFNEGLATDAPGSNADENSAVCVSSVLIGGSKGPV